MGYWEILGIEPTKEISLIKKAYAEKVKFCHPEEDPEGFVKLRAAYKQAVAWAKLPQPVLPAEPIQTAEEKEDAEENEAEKLDFSHVAFKDTEQEKNIEEQNQGWDFSQVGKKQEAQQTESAKEKAAEETEFLRFENLSQLAEEVFKKQTEAADKMLEEAEKLFHFSGTRNDKDAWQAFMEMHSSLSSCMMKRYWKGKKQPRNGFGMNCWRMTVLSTPWK